MSQEAIIVDKVYKCYGKADVLRDISLKVPSGELFGMLGPSGAGKTTLVRILAGMASATKGAVTVLGEAMPSLAVISKIGFMAQADALYGDLTARDNLEFFASLYGLSGATRDKRIMELLELVTLTEQHRKRVSTFSGGMKRRLSLAIALLHEPELLILDEPTTGMDPVLRKSVWDELKELQRKGTTIIITTHAMEEAEKCQRLGLIREGQLIAIGSPEELMNETQSDRLEDAFIAYGGKMK